MRSPVLLAALGAAAFAAAAAPAAQAITATGPEPNARVGARPVFGIQLDAGEESPRVVLSRPGAVNVSITGTYANGEYHPHLPIEPGRWTWVAAAYRGSELVSTAPRPLRVRRVVRMERARFARRGASVSGSYVFATNAPQLTHRVEVFHRGRRVSRRQSTIAHSPSRRMPGGTFRFTAALTTNSPPFGRVHAGTWRVRVTVSAQGRRDSASRRYVIR